MIAPNKILIDADAFVALNHKDDPNHTRALLLVAQIRDQKTDLLTSDPAFGEAITIISQEVALEPAVKFALKTLRGPIDIVEVDSALRNDALEIFSKQTSKNSRFTDCINMAVMKRERIDTIFSFDKHYKKNGFKRFGIDE
ncbi:MAG: type II toxin-antitoxin system VapC family toxin [Candidatus Blackburnbacteria bacterium]|nr:type II toxin-antitoxin system VapC family toxin [Candidatus Blackburnbacteria bacterium]